MAALNLHIPTYRKAAVDKYAPMIKHYIIRAVKYNLGFLHRGTYELKPLRKKARQKRGRYI